MKVKRLGCESVAKAGFHRVVPKATASNLDSNGIVTDNERNHRMKKSILILCAAFGLVGCNQQGGGTDTGEQPSSSTMSNTPSSGTTSTNQGGATTPGSSSSGSSSSSGTDTSSSGSKP